jgi:hypothetical protein
VEVPPGKHPPPYAALVKHDEEHDNEIGAHEVVHAATLTVEFPPNDAALGEYNPPPPPPIRDTTQTPQVGPIEKHSDEHDKEHDERVLAPVITDAVELSQGSISSALQNWLAGTSVSLLIVITQRHCIE